jgi:hypothetical protein
MWASLGLRNGLKMPLSMRHRATRGLRIFLRHRRGPALRAGRAPAGVCLPENSKVESRLPSGKCPMTSLLFLKPHRKLPTTLAESNEYSTRHATGVAYFSRKPNKPPRLPRWWIGWELKSEGITVSIKLPIAGAEKFRAQLPDQVAVTRWFPMQLKRRGVELRLIVGDHNRSASIVDLSLLKAVARAHRWFDEISTGNARSLAAIAAREGLNVRYVGRLIRLAFLAPDIVESIVEGRQPMTLTAEALTRRIDLPLSWCAQRTVLNVE